MLIQHKANVCCTSKASQTALHFAAEMGHVDVVASLLDAAGKQLIVMKDQGNWTPLHHAAEQGSVDIVQLLILVSCCLLPVAQTCCPRCPQNIVSRAGLGGPCHGARLPPCNFTCYLYTLPCTMQGLTQVLGCHIVRLCRLSARLYALPSLMAECHSACRPCVARRAGPGGRTRAAGHSVLRSHLLPVCMAFCGGRVVSLPR